MLNHAKPLKFPEQINNWAVLILKNETGGNDMKKLIITAGLLIFGFTNVTNGQAPKTIDERARAETILMGQQLKLTATQSANIYNINMYIDEKFDKIRNENYLNTKVILDSIKQLDIEKEGLMEKVLTYRQFATYIKGESKGAFALK